MCKFVTLGTLNHYNTIKGVTESQIWTGRRSARGGGESRAASGFVSTVSFRGAWARILAKCLAQVLGCIGSEKRSTLICLTGNIAARVKALTLVSMPTHATRACFVQIIPSEEGIHFAIHVSLFRHVMLTREQVDDTVHVWLIQF